ncbi:hypothetical protein LCGC14_0404350 [marine sediment metagenome]|uniref:Uncharacterized protein n=1 Tax=marine sediment metagenome TaxID=412755 RepID=A0A0F9VHZ2_9ZZZZ
MSRNWNDFCLYCVGNKVKDIRECEDRACPFYSFRHGGLEPEVEKEICQKIVTEVLTRGD